MDNKDPLRGSMPSGSMPSGGPSGGLRLVSDRDRDPGTPPAETRRVVSAPAPKRVPLGQILTEMGAVAPGDLLKAAAMRMREDVRLGDILLAHGWVREADLLLALARQWRTSAVDLEKEPPDPRLIDALGPELCLSEGMVPWRRMGGTLVIATSRPEHFARLRAQLLDRQSRLPADARAGLRMVVTTESGVRDALLARRQTALIRRAEQRVPLHESCRATDPRLTSTIALGALVLAALGLLAAPLAVFSVIFCWAVLTLYLTSGLKFICWLAEALGQRRARRAGPVRASPAPPPAASARPRVQQTGSTPLWANIRPLRQVDARRPGGSDPNADTTAPTGLPRKLPMISVLVPLYQECDIADRLVHRLGRLTYPRELLDLLLVVEEDDTTTRAALARASLPQWMRVVTVPRGPIRTKPRAMNYALSFCRGSIVGVYDAEDRPDPEQLHDVARRFASAPPEVACLQGVLDYYNPRSNWLARCFTIEYAVWFRAVLPGLARLGLVVPLGGTTLFFRRDTLEALGGWDAHNVTEDADLGLRLARHGYRTELLATVTLEEANCRALPWVRQRSRWQKGYAMTWAVHMRNPARLWRDLGAWRFLSVQVLFLGSLSQYLLMPLLWSCWLILFGLPHPLSALLPAPALNALLLSFLACELIHITIGAWATRGPAHRHLIPWVPSLQLYFPLGALAGWRALFEAITRPFHWEKTAHGLFDAREEEADAAPMPVVASSPAAARVAEFTRH